MVEVTADATTLYSITVTEQNETQGIGTVACEQLPDAMVAANSYNVDGIAGATVTSNALKEAVWTLPPLPRPSLPTAAWKRPLKRWTAMWSSWAQAVPV